MGAFEAVLSVLGCEFMETVYQETLSIEIQQLEIPFIRKINVPVIYKGVQLQRLYRADFILFDRIIIELKALSALAGDHITQVINYLKATGLRVSLLMNFVTSSLQHQRYVLC